MHERHVRFGTVLDTTAAVLTSACGRYVGVWTLRRRVEVTSAWTLRLSAWTLITSTSTSRRRKRATAQSDHESNMTHRRRHTSVQLIYACGYALADDRYQILYYLANSLSTPLKGPLALLIIIWFYCLRLPILPGQYSTHRVCLRAASAQLITNCLHNHRHSNVLKLFLKHSRLQPHTIHTTSNNIRYTSANI